MWRTPTSTGPTSLTVTGANEFENATHDYEAGRDQSGQPVSYDYEVGGGDQHDGGSRRGSPWALDDADEENLTDSNVTSSGNETTSPRDRARAGMKRRRLQNRSTGKKLRAGIVPVSRASSRSC